MGGSEGGPAGTANPITPAAAVAMLTMQGVVFTAVGIGLWHLSGRALEDFVTFSFDQVAIGIIFAASLIGLAAAVFRAFPGASDHLVRLQAETYRFLGPKLGWPAVWAISLNAGISEEAALRAGLQTLLGDQIGAVAAIIAGSALFAALHLAKPLITALLFGIGLLFGTVYWLTDSLLAVVIAHVLYDVWALRYLNREMHRLDLFSPPAQPSATLAKASEPS